jgi:hypothetical protein
MLFHYGVYLENFFLNDPYTINNRWALNLSILGWFQTVHMIPERITLVQLQKITGVEKNMG